MRVKAWDLYRLRRARLIAERRELEAQLAQNEAKAVLLRLELKYDLLAKEAVLDLHTGQVTLSTSLKKEVADESGGDESQGTQRPP